MEEKREQEKTPESAPATDVRAVIREVIQEFVQTQHTKAEPAYKAELMEERKRREQLERRVNDLVQENIRSRQIAEEADRNARVRDELQRLGVVKLDLAYRAVKDDVARTEDGRLVARGAQGETELAEYLSKFVNENPELLPARIAGGAGTGVGKRASTLSSGLDLDKIKPGMSTQELEQVRNEIARLAAQAMRGE
ncbi:MAG: hypothetical protein ACK5AZ_11630 [Bryobacteraceae bacterium]